MCENSVSPGIFQGLYSVTKATVINMTKVFTKECVPFGIRCNALLPGLTDTKFASALLKCVCAVTRLTDDGAHEHFIPGKPAIPSSCDYIHQYFQLSIYAGYLCNCADCINTNMLKEIQVEYMPFAVSRSFELVFLRPKGVDRHRHANQRLSFKIG